ncbi:hypothetical protein Tco_0226507 [Tanacetum coccineum]
MKVEESLNVTFDEIPLPTKLSQLVDDDVGEEEAIERKVKVDNNNVEVESIEVDKYIKEMLKKFGLEDSKPTKTLMSTEIKLTKDDKADSMDCTKHRALAVSMTEAEYTSAGKACQQALWMKQALIDYDIRLDDVPIMCDNKGAIDLSKNPVQHSRTKHIEIHHQFLRDIVQKGNISIEKVASKDNLADILTKLLKREQFNYLRLGLGMMEHIPDNESSSS